MKADKRANGFEEALDEWVRAALVRGVRTFPELVRSLPGVYPADALRVIGRLRQELPIDWQLSGNTSIVPALGGWPVEHPLDFDWRFTPEAVRFLIDRSQGTASDPVVFLGAPSLARELAALGWPAAISLFDQNPDLVEAIREWHPRVAATCLDLVWGEPVADGGAAIAVADPPWYPEHLVAFLWTASRLTRLGGRVLLSLPPEGTRPGIMAERNALFAVAASFGLRLSLVEPGVLAYRTPLFEKNALTAAGVPAVPLDWRRGDLTEFNVAEKTAVVRPTPIGTPDQWDEEAIGIVRIKCRRCPDLVFRDPTLFPTVAGDILPSVSRRDPTRAGADVWTCGNRVFRCGGTGVFRAIMSAIGRATGVVDAVAGLLGRELSSEELTLVRRAMAQATELVRIEKMEIEQAGDYRAVGPARTPIVPVGSR
jgi:hypothetical protein